MTTVIDRSNVHLYQSGYVGTEDEAIAYVRPFNMKAGSVHKGHSHYIHHVGVLISGSVRVSWRREDGSAEGVTEILAAPCLLTIRKDTWHEIEALEDSVWWCWFSGAEAEKEYGDSNAVPWHLEKERG
jgi:hypothetical protein